MAVKATGTFVADRYRIVRALGRGGSATVYLAEDEKLGRQVAIKRLHADSAEEVERRFVREAKLGASLNHPNLVWVFDTVADDEGVLIIMEYVDGPTLAREIADEPLRPRHAVQVVAAMASALEHAHEQGVIHRDVKPANVLLGRGGVIKLADLGIATVVDSTRITHSGVALGTASYMAPEQLEGERVTAASDIYALATVAFEVLGGRKAHAGRTPMEVAHSITSKPPPDLRDAWQRAPDEAAELLRRAMSHDPSERPESACDFAAELARALGEETTARVLLDAAREATGGAALAAPAAAIAPEPPSPEPEPPPPEPEPPTPAPTTRARRPDPPRRTEPARRPEPPRRQYPAPARSSKLARGSRWLLAGAVALLALLVVAVVLASGGGEERASQHSADRPAAEPDSSPQQGGEGGAPAPAPSAGEPGTPKNAAEGRRLNQQGFALLNQGKSAEAVPILQRSVASFPSGTTDIQYAFALFNLGKALRLSGRPEEAIPILERRLKIPNQTDTVQRELDAARKAAG